MRKVDAILIIVLMVVGLAVPIMLVAQQKKNEKTELIANDGSWSMKEIHLKLNQDNFITMVSHDVEHSFVVESMNISVVLYPGHTVTINIHPTEAGTFMFMCNTFCSPKHITMTGNLIVS